MTDRSPRSIVLGLMGHVGLVLAIVADFYRRSNDGSLALLLSGVGMVALIAGAILLVRHPRLFFLGAEENGMHSRSLRLIARMFAWVFVVGVPVLWLIAMTRLQSGSPLGLGIRAIGRYVFFAWIAGALILSPKLFGKPR